MLIASFPFIQIRDSKHESLSVNYCNTIHDPMISCSQPLNAQRTPYLLKCSLMNYCIPKTH
jgi:hypothetical protein